MHKSHDSIGLRIRPVIIGDLGQSRLDFLHLGFQGDSGIGRGLVAWRGRQGAARARRGAMPLRCPKHLETSSRTKSLGQSSNKFNKDIKKNLFRCANVILDPYALANALNRSIIATINGPSGFSASGLDSKLTQASAPSTQGSVDNAFFEHPM